jgi:hypothetical protein
LTLYSSGGLEKINKASEPIKPVITKVKAGQSEARIVRNPDGTTDVVYPDSDEEEAIEIGPTESATDMVKGYF